MKALLLTTLTVTSLLALTDKEIIQHSDKCADAGMPNVVMCTFYANDYTKKHNLGTSMAQLCTIACTDPKLYKEKLRDK